MIKLEIFRLHFIGSLPPWYDEEVHAQTIQFVMKGEKLRACKYLWDVSKFHNYTVTYDLQWTKRVMEHISEMLRTTPSDELINNVQNVICPTGLSIDGLERILRFVPKYELEHFLSLRTKTNNVSEESNQKSDK